MPPEEAGEGLYLEEASDHITVEAGFIGYLCLKEAYARVRGNEEETEVTAKATERFRQSHLSTFAWPLADRLEKTGSATSPSAPAPAPSAWARPKTAGRQGIVCQFCAIPIVQWNVGRSEECPFSPN